MGARLKCYPMTFAKAISDLGSTPSRSTGEPEISPGGGRGVTLAPREPVNSGFSGGPAPVSTGWIEAIRGYRKATTENSANRNANSYEEALPMAA